MKIVDGTAGGAGDQKTAESFITPSPQEASSPFELVLLALITAVAAALRFHSLAAKSFWFDEGVSVAIARLDWYNFVRILWRREANMSLYYLFLRSGLTLEEASFSFGLCRFFLPSRLSP